MENPLLKAERMAKTAVIVRKAVQASSDFIPMAHGETTLETSEDENYTRNELR
jgi:hypothetical protein